MPLELQGRDEENVPIFTGVPEVHATAPWLFTMGTGALLVGIFLIAGVHALAVQHDLFRFIASLCVGGFVAGSVVLGSVWWYRVTCEMPHLATLDDLALRLGLDAGRLQIFAAENRVRPRVKVNGKMLYRQRDFGDPASLLRAASGPGGVPGSMLRSAAPVHPNQLPRPAEVPNAEPFVTEPIQQTVDASK